MGDLSRKKGDSVNVKNWIIRCFRVLFSSNIYFFHFDELGDEINVLKFYFMYL